MNYTPTEYLGRKRPCPVCGCTASKVLFKQRFEQLSDISFLSGYDVVICRECGAGFASGIPKQETFDEYYRDLSKYEYQHSGGKGSASDEQRYRDVANTIAPLIAGRETRILELGCATGGLLATLREHGFSHVQGLDPSRGCAQSAWDLYKIPVFASSLFRAAAQVGSFDFVIAVGVLEHVEDLAGAATEIRKLLSPEGCIYVEVPDGSRLPGRPDAPFQEFSTEHINFFSIVSLTNLFEQHGFRKMHVGNAVRQQNENTTCPSAYGVYERAEGYTGTVVRDDDTEPGLLRYIEESKSTDSKVRGIIQERALGKSILVWGTGAHTQRLIAAGAFENIKIQAFIDSNPQYQGKHLQGKPVLRPSAIIGSNAPILISSRGFQREIRNQIRNDLRMNNEIILLYE